MAMTPPRVSPGHTPLGTPSHTPLANTPPGHTPAQRLKQTGASILAGQEGLRPSSNASEQSGRRSGRSNPQASPVSPNYVAQMPGEKSQGNDDQIAFGQVEGQQRRCKGPPEQVPKAIWTDSVAHLQPDEEWPLHAVPVFVFGGVDRPRPSYREEVKFTLRNDKYVSFALRLRCGTGDHYMGGTVGLLHNPERQEAQVGDPGQLATILDLVVQPDNSVIVTAIGDLDCTVLRTWMPRGLRGLQLAFVDVHRHQVPELQPILTTCHEEPGFGLFGQLVARANGFEEVAQAIDGTDGPFTVFVPQDSALLEALGGGSLEDMLQVPYLQAILACHIIRGRIPFEALYSGRTLKAIDGTVLMVTFLQRPRGGPCINEIPGGHMDIFCSNGIVHSIKGVLMPAPRSNQRR